MCQISAELSNILGKILMAMNKISLTTLEIRNCKIDDVNGNYLHDVFLTKNLINIENISYYGINSKSPCTLNILNSFQIYTYNKLKILNLSGNEIGEEGWKSLFSVLQNGSLSILEELNIESI